MIMIGVTCEKCCSHLLDSGDKCVHCGHPYNEFVLKMVRHHQAAKELLVARAKQNNPTEEEMMRDIKQLGCVTTKLAETQKRIGGDIPEELIERGFQVLE